MGDGAVGRLSIDSRGAVLAALTFALVVVGGPSLAHAIPLGERVDGQLLPGGSLNVQNDFYFKYNTFLDEIPDDDTPPPLEFVELVNRLTVDLQIRSFNVGAQLDVVGIAPTCAESAYRSKYAETYGTGIRCQNPNVIYGDGWGEPALESVLVRLEKVWARYTSKHVDVSLGDFYAAFGRGILLSMTKKPEVDQDNSLLGARIDLRSKPVDFTFLAGTPNPQEVSMVLRNQRTRKFEPTLLIGGVLKLRPHKMVEITGQAMGYDLLERPAGGFGGTLAINGIGDAVDLFVEADGFAYGSYDEDDGDVESEFEGDPTGGWAIYGSATGYAGPLTLLFEMKRYKDAQVLRRDGPVIPVAYNTPPSLEWETSTNEDIFTSIASNDVFGWRLTGELYFLKTSTTLSVAFTNSWDFEPHPPYSVQQEVGLGPVASISQPIHLPKADLHLKGHVGYRHDIPLRSPPESFPEERRAEKADEYLRQSGLLHFSVDIGINFGKVAFEWVTYYRRYHWSLEEPFCWDDGGEQKCSSDDGWLSAENAISLTFLGKYTAALHVDYSDDPIVQRLTNDGAPGNLYYDPDFRRSVYIGGEFIVRPISNLEVNVFVGSQKAGVVCTGGACRTVPSFTGAKARVTVNF